jgi:hypothetical protein
MMPLSEKTFGKHYSFPAAKNGPQDAPHDLTADLGVDSVGGALGYSGGTSR